MEKLTGYRKKENEPGEAYVPDKSGEEYCEPGRNNSTSLIRGFMRDRLSRIRKRNERNNIIAIIFILLMILIIAIFFIRL